MNVTIDDASPVVTYSTGWSNDPTSITGGVTDLYWNTGHQTYTDGATSTVFFTGSAVYLYGRRGADTGCMGVELDGERVQNVQLYSDSDTDYQQLIFGAVGLDTSSSHNLTIVNLPGESAAEQEPPSSGWGINLDYIVFTGPASGSINTVKLDDGDPSITYSTNWANNSNLIWDYYESTNHQVKLNGATMSYTFTGNAIEIAGAINYDHRTYQVSIDNGTPIEYNGTNAQLVTKLPLFIATGLEEKEHTVVLTNSGAGQYTVDIDYIVVNSSKADSDSSSSMGLGAAIASGGSQTTSLLLPQSTSELQQTASATSTVTYSASGKMYTTTMTQAAETLGTPNLAPVTSVVSGTIYSGGESQSSFSSSSKGKGAIAGMILGVVLLFVAVLVVLIRHRRQTRRMAARESRIREQRPRWVKEEAKRWSDSSWGSTQSPSPAAWESKNDGATTLTLVSPASPRLSPQTATLRRNHASPSASSGSPPPYQGVAAAQCDKQPFRSFSGDLRWSRSTTSTAPRAAGVSSSSGVVRPTMARVACTPHEVRSTEAVEAMSYTQPCRARNLTPASTSYRSHGRRPTSNSSSGSEANITLSSDNHFFPSGSQSSRYPTSEASLSSVTRSDYALPSSVFPLPAGSQAFSGGPSRQPTFSRRTLTIPHDSYARRSARYTLAPSESASQAAPEGTQQRSTWRTMGSILPNIIMGRRSVRPPGGWPVSVNADGEESHSEMACDRRSGSW